MEQDSVSPTDPLQGIGLCIYNGSDNEHSIPRTLKFVSTLVGENIFSRRNSPLVVRDLSIVA
jgi:hypothetical protein